MPKRSEKNLHDDLNNMFSNLQNTEHNMLSENTKYFQRSNTSDTKQSSKVRTKFFIPAVSLWNEMKATGFGQVLLEY